MLAGDGVKITHANRCPVCKRYFTTPQGLGLHFAAIKRGAKTCIARTARAGER